MRLPFAILAAMAASVPGVSAAPQLIALVPTDQPVPFVCAGETCRVELSTYCLQEHRAAPKPGVAYTIAGSAGALAVIDRDGARVPLDVAPAIAAARTYVAVTLTVPASAIAPGSAGLVVGEGIVLVPAPEANDGNPQTPEDIAQAQAVAASLGRALVDGAPAVRVALDLGRAANAIEAGADRATFGGQISLDAGAVYAACQDQETAGGADLLACLRGRRDGLVSDTNRAFWRALAAGS